MLTLLLTKECALPGLQENSFSSEAMSIWKCEAVSFGVHDDQENEN